MPPDLTVVPPSGPEPFTDEEVAAAMARLDVEACLTAAGVTIEALEMTGLTVGASYADRLSSGQVPLSRAMLGTFVAGVVLGLRLADEASKR